MNQDVLPSLRPILPAEVNTPFPSCQKLDEKEERLHDQTELHSNLQTYLYVTEPPFSSTCATQADGWEGSAENSLHESVDSGSSRTERESECEDELNSDRGQDEKEMEEGDNSTEVREKINQGHDKSHGVTPTSPGAESSHSEYLQFQSSSGYIADGANLMCTSPNLNTCQQSHTFQQHQLASDHVLLSDDAATIPSSVPVVGDTITSPLMDSMFGKSTKLQDQLCCAHNLLFDVEYDLELMEKEVELNQPKDDYLGQPKNVPEYLQMPEASPPGLLTIGQAIETSTAGSESCSY